MHNTYRVLTLVAITLVLSALLPLSSKAQNKPHRKSPITATQSTPFNPTDTQQVIEHFAKLRDSDFSTWLRSTLSSTTHHQLNSNGFARPTWLAQLNIVQDQVTCDRLQQQAAPVIRLFGREHTVQILYLPGHLSKYADHCRILFGSFNRTSSTIEARYTRQRSIERTRRPRTCQRYSKGRIHNSLEKRRPSNTQKL